MRLSLAVSIETPENVVLTHQLAGPAYRILAYLIDLGIRIGILFVGSILLAVAAIFLPGIAIGSLLLMTFLLEWFYTIGFEYFWRGQTPGKVVCGLRVVQENGGPLSWWGAVLRNLLRIADMLPIMLIYGDSAGMWVMFPIYGPGLVTMVFTGRMQRLGDLAARTMVVHSERWQLPRTPVIYDRIAPLTASEINRFIPRPQTLALIDQFLSRRSALTYQRGHELAGELARLLVRQLDYRGDLATIEKYPMAFLARVYVTFTVAKSVVSASPVSVTASSTESANAVRGVRV